MMISMLDMKLDSVETTESFIINKRVLNKDQMKLTISRRYEKNNNDPHKYAGTCSAELKLISELSQDMLNSTFYVKVTIVGNFTCDAPAEEITHDSLNTAVVLELYPHLRATMASVMASAGMTPYLIPNSFIVNA